MPTVAELQAAVAKQYGFHDYETFRNFFAANFGKGMLRTLEAGFKKREQETTTGSPHFEIEEKVH